MGDKSKRSLTVTSSKVITSGRSDKGEWTLYEVHAVKEDGQPVDQKLRAFAELPIGVLTEYDVEEVRHEKYGLSFTLSLPRSGGGGGGSAGARLGPKVDELRDRVENLEQNISWLDGRLAVLEGRAPTTLPVQSAASAAPPAGAPPAAPAPAAPAAPAAPSTADDDIPFARPPIPDREARRRDVFSGDRWLA